MLRQLLAGLGKYSLFVISFALGVVVFRIWIATNFTRPAQIDSTEVVGFEVAKGSNLKTIAKELERLGVVKKWYSLYILGKLTPESKGASIDNIQVGEYELSPSQTPKEILTMLLEHRIVQHPITIPEGVNLSDVMEIIAKSKLATREQIKPFLYNRDLMLSFDIPAASAEGFMFPETYNFSKPITPKEIVSRIIAEGLKRLDDTLPGWRNRSQELGFTPYQAMTLASIIEKESADNEDRVKVASVFFNRLRVGMPLQSDPTVIYGIPNFNGNLTKEDLKAPTPYNTYVNTGLPPSPIASPSMDSIKAALYPVDSDYLYFVSRKDGSHQFSATYKEHVNAVNAFQRGAS